MKVDTSKQNCSCPDNGKESVVITIETCCRKTCNNKKGSKSRSKHKIGDSDDQIEESAIEAKTRKSSLHQQKSPPKPPPRLFKLPVLCGRHHGPGCAMEISILEKHEESCLYKKDDNDERHPIDDRVGSYDVIGRMVFRTCNAAEVQSITSSGGDSPQQLSAGGISQENHHSTLKFNEIAPKQITEERQRSVMSQTQEDSSSQTNGPARLKSEFSQTGSFHSALSAEPDAKTPSEIRAELLEQSSYTRRMSQNDVISARVAVGEKFPIKEEKLYSTLKQPKLQQQTYEYLHQVPRKEFRRIAESRKMFPPRPAAENLSQLQNVASFSYRKKPSDETITSLLGPPGTENRKSNFFSFLRKSKEDDESSVRPTKRKKKTSKKK